MAIIDFENVTPGRYAAIPDGYDGFHWHDLGLASHEPADTGYAQVLNSGVQAGFNVSGAPGYFSADRDFDLKSGYFAAAWSNDLKVKIAGFDDGVKVASLKVSLDQAKTYIAFGPEFDSVDRVRISTHGGVDAKPGDGEGTQVAFDDLVVQFERASSGAHHHLAGHGDHAGTSDFVV